MNTKRKLFCDSYLANQYNGTKAVIDARYNCKDPASYAVYLLKIPEISQYIKEATGKLSQEFELSTKTVLGDVRKCKLEAWDRGNMKTYLRACELEGKYLAMWTEKHQVEAHVKQETYEEYLQRITLDAQK